MAMYNFAIQKGLPEKNSERSSRAKYPFVDLQPGTFFEIPLGNEGAVINKQGQPKVSGLAYAFGKTRGWKICVRRQESGAVRVYRTA